MARRGRNTMTWHIVKNKENGAILYFSGAEEPEMLVSTLYEDIAVANTEDEAQKFILALKTDLSAPRIAFLEEERELIDTISKNPNALRSVGITDELNEIIEQIHREDPIPCFGNCKSAEGDKKCATCYSSCSKGVPDTWKLCAMATIVNTLKSIFLQENGN